MKTGVDEEMVDSGPKPFFCLLQKILKGFLLLSWNVGFLPPFSSPTRGTKGVAPGYLAGPSPPCQLLPFSQTAVVRTVAGNASRGRRSHQRRRRGRSKSGQSLRLSPRSRPKIPRAPPAAFPLFAVVFPTLLLIHSKSGLGLGSHSTATVRPAFEAQIRRRQCRRILALLLLLFPVGCWNGWG